MLDLALKMLLGDRAKYSRQTFYSFVLENLRNLGALKALGASDSVLSRMVMVQTLTVGLIALSAESLRHPENEIPSDEAPCRNSRRGHS